MKVLMQSRKNFFELRGGDTVQLEKTKMELEKLGVEVDFSLDFEPDLSNYDLVHLSNVTRIQETYLHVKNAKKQGKPIVLSTTYFCIFVYPIFQRFRVASFLEFLSFKYLAIAFIFSSVSIFT